MAFQHVQPEPTHTGPLYTSIHQSSPKFEFSSNLENTLTENPNDTVSSKSKLYIEYAIVTKPHKKLEAPNQGMYRTLIRLAVEMSSFALSCPLVSVGRISACNSIRSVTQERIRPSLTHSMTRCCRRPSHAISALRDSFGFGLATRHNFSATGATWNSTSPAW